MEIFIMNEYKKDFCLWIDHIASLLKKRELSIISDEELNYLIDEIESMGRTEKYDADEKFITLLKSLMIFNIIDPCNGIEDIREVEMKRKSLYKILETSPSLVKHL